jgi:hypothetical protein
MQPPFEVADVLNQHWQQVETHPHINAWQLRTLGALKRCRTAALGGHADACTSCGTVRISYNSCRNRHCPKCQGREREAWIQKREEDLSWIVSPPLSGEVGRGPGLFHVVFTLPDTLNQLAMHQLRQVYDALFEAAWDTINSFGKDAKHLAAQTGMIAILHTWGQQLTLHPHLHCIIPGGGLTKQGKWKTARSKGKYLFPVKALSKVFRAKYVAALKQKITNLDKCLVDALFKKEWVVYAKRPFGNAQAVVEYLGRYTHKVAISNHRIKNIKDGKVTFTYKNYRNGSVKEELTLDAMEFIRRFTMHILPKGFVRIRHYGILSSTGKLTALPKIKAQTVQVLVIKQEPRVLNNYNPQICPCCKTATMITIEIFQKRGPPKIEVNWQTGKVIPNLSTAG